jgi:D-alanyl-D-alanine carboxypeptidase
MGRLRSHRRRFAIALVVTLAGCTTTASGGSDTTASVEPSVAPGTSVSPSEAAEAFPIEAFSDISEDRVSEEMTAEFQAVLDDMAGRAGVSATVMSADGTWSGAAGKADGVRDVTVDDQFAIASVTKPIIAAQVMQMVEAGELDLDDPAANHLPPDLGFDANGATIRQLLGMRSGIPDYAGALWDRMLTDRQHRWTPAEILALVAADRSPAGEEWEFADTNYLLLGLIIEQVSGRPVADVLRDGVLRVHGTERLIYQPDEVPTEPMAMPFGGSTAARRKGGGYLPSLAGATAAGAAGSMASDSRSVARWYRAFCAGEIVSEASLAEMSTLRDSGPGEPAYGLALNNPADPGAPYANAVGHADPGVPYANAVGHAGQHEGYVSWAGCVPDDGLVVVVLINDTVDISVITQRLIDTVP